MKSSYLLVAILASFRVSANPAFEFAHMFKPSRAPDPPPAPTPFPPSTDGVLRDASVINYTPGSSCWTPPASRPAPSNNFKHGTCSVCLVQRNGTDTSADYLLWARDNENNAMGNLGATTVWPVDQQQPDTQRINASMPMGGSPLLLQSENLGSPFAMVYIVWATPPHNPDDSSIWANPSVPHAMFNTSPGGEGNNCTDAGRALDGAVRYATCSFHC